MDATRAPYQYVPLAVGGPTFRIAYLMPGPRTGAFECDLLEIPVTAKSGFSALSYACGDDEIVDRVLIRGRYIGITSNLAHALRRLRDEHQPRAFWIDALCINQYDLAEKNQQIPFMTHIYGSTSLVTIFLGLEEDGSKNIPNLCARIYKAFEKSGVQLEAGKRPVGDHKLPTQEYAKFGLPKATDDVWNHFRALVLRPWFTRVWIIQEAVLPADADVVCGDWTIPFTLLKRVLYFAIVLDLPVFSTPGSGIRTQALRILMFIQWLGGNRARSKRVKLLHLL
jgi:hypothetical protein